MPLNYLKKKVIWLPVSEASTAGNAAATPAAVAAAAAGAAGSGAITQAEADAIQNIVPIATAQISISTIATALLCPVLVIIVDKYQRKRGIYGDREDLGVKAEERTQSEEPTKDVVNN